MPLKFLFANNVRSHLTAPLTSSATTFTITAGDGAKFPSPDGSKGERIALTIVDDLGNMEIVHVTKRATDTFTVARAQEGTTAKEFAENAIVELRITAASLNCISNAVYVSPLNLGVPEKDTGVDLKLPIPGDIKVASSGITYRWVTLDSLRAGWDSVESKSFIKADSFVGKLNGSLTTARSIDGILFSANADVIRFAVSTTAADVAEKVVSIPNLPKDIPEGTIILVYPTITTTVTPITLKVNDSPAYPTWHSQSQVSNWSQGKSSFYCFHDSKWWLIFPHIATNRVAQMASTNDANYPILSAYVANLAVDSTSYTRFTAGVTLNPSTNTITATAFNGTATNATQWNGATQYKSTAGPSGGVNGDIWFQYI